MTRQAQCYCCKKLYDSEDQKVMQGERRGPGTRHATEACRHCGVAHRNATYMGCNHFESHGPWEYDLCYDGCEGWD